MLLFIIAIIPTLFEPFTVHFHFTRFHLPVHYSQLTIKLFALFTTMYACCFVRLLLFVFSMLCSYISELKKNVDTRLGQSHSVMLYWSVHKYILLKFHVYEYVVFCLSFIGTFLASQFVCYELQTIFVLFMLLCVYYIMLAFVSCWKCMAWFMPRSLSKKATIHQVTTMLATSKNVQFPGHNY